MTVTTADELTRIIQQHREDVAAAKLAAEQRARDDEHTRHACEIPIRSIALPVFREWSERLAVEGYPSRVEDRLGCRPPTLVFHFAPRGSPESTLMLVCESGPAVAFRALIEGKDAGPDVHTPLDGLEAGAIVEGLSRFLTAALAAMIPRRSDCGPHARSG
jgi:hypothetical protein